jgi:hypothetical protein
MPVSRRAFLTTAGSGAALAGLGPSIARGAVAYAAGSQGTGPADAAAAQPADQEAAAASLPASFPTQDPERVRELVRVAHFDLSRVKALVDRQPAMARAAWDWGFGDWESALGAASHMGNRPIAEYLLANGARPDVFTAAMLGHLDVVKACVAAMPGAQRMKGPHGITLLAHARAGGERALPVLSYLTALGDADPVVQVSPLTPEDLSALPGRYVFGSQPRDFVLAEPYQAGLSLRRAEGMARPLSHLGGRVFSPAGADGVRIRFAAGNPAASLTVHDPDLVLTARRREG